MRLPAQRQRVWRAVGAAGRGSAPARDEARASFEQLVRVRHGIQRVLERERGIMREQVAGATG